MITKWIFVSWFSMLSTNPTQAKVQFNSNDVLLATAHTRPVSPPIEQHQQIRSRFGIKMCTFQSLNFRIVSLVVGHNTAKPHVASSCWWLFIFISMFFWVHHHFSHQIYKKLINISRICGVNPPFQLINVPFFQGNISYLWINPPFSPTPKTCFMHKQSHRCFRRWRKWGIVMDRAAEGWRQQVP